MFVFKSKWWNYLIGVNDNGDIVGVNPNKVNDLKDNIMYYNSCGIKIK